MANKSIVCQKFIFSLQLKRHSFQHSKLSWEMMAHQQKWAAYVYWICDERSWIDFLKNDFQVGKFILNVVDSLASLLISQWEGQLVVGLVELSKLMQPQRLFSIGNWLQSIGHSGHAIGTWKSSQLVLVGFKVYQSPLSIIDHSAYTAQMLKGH
jgi:hypothetical protein